MSDNEYYYNTSKNYKTEKINEQLVTNKIQKCPESESWKKIKRSICHAMFQTQLWCDTQKIHEKFYKTSKKVWKKYKKNALFFEAMPISIICRLKN